MKGAELVLRESILNAAVRNLTEFGYPCVTKTNIFTDYLYAAFFEEMLTDEDNRKTKLRAQVCDRLLSEIKRDKAP